MTARLKKLLSGKNFQKGVREYSGDVDFGYIIIL